jgi:hypothetical protein
MKAEIVRSMKTAFIIFKYYHWYRRLPFADRTEGGDEKPTHENHQVEAVDLAVQTNTCARTHCTSEYVLQQRLRTTNSHQVLKLASTNCIAIL